jgi:hypothetical protein
MKTPTIHLSIKDTKQDFVERKRSFKKALSQNLIDKNLIPVLSMINDDPRLATAWACESHKDKGGSFYVTFVHDENFPLVIKIYDNFIKSLEAHNFSGSKYKYELLNISLSFDLLWSGNNLTKAATLRYIPIDYKDKIFLNEEHKLTFIGLFNDSVSKSLL